MYLWLPQSFLHKERMRYFHKCWAWGRQAFKRATWRLYRKTSGEEDLDRKWLRWCNSENEWDPNQAKVCKDFSKQHNEDIMKLQIGVAPECDKNRMSAERRNRKSMKSAIENRTGWTCVISLWALKVILSQCFSTHLQVSTQHLCDPGGQRDTAVHVPLTVNYVLQVCNHRSWPKIYFQNIIRILCLF